LTRRTASSSVRCNGADRARPYFKESVASVVGEEETRLSCVDIYSRLTRKELGWIGALVEHLRAK
jgi:hypothetical protein